MRKSSWIILAICVLVSLGLGVAYLLSRSSTATLSQDLAVQMLHHMQDDVAHKRVNNIMGCIASAPDTRIANLKPDQLRLLLSRAFRSTGQLQADCSNVTFAGGKSDATMGFDLVVKNTEPNMVSEEYSGHITLQLRRVLVSHLLGIYQTKEWRIVGADTTGKDPSTYGDL